MSLRGREDRHRRAAQRGQVLALQRAHARRARRRPTTPSPRSSPTWPSWACPTSGSIGWPRPSAPRRSCTRRSSSTTSPASCAAPTRARGSATSSWATSARPTRSCTWCARTTTRRWCTPRASVDPLADVETIETELLYADLEQAERRLERVEKQARSLDKELVAEERWLREVIEALQRGPRRAHGAAARRRHPARWCGCRRSPPSRCSTWPTWPRASRSSRRRRWSSTPSARGARAAAVSARLDSELAS